jgi:hypothetical protein
MRLLLVTGAVNGDTINYTQQLLPLNSLMLVTILLMTLEIILTILLFQLMVF